MGMTESDFQNLLKEQDGKCSICQRAIYPAFGMSGQRIKRELWANIDHCHKTGFVRGILCTPCNHGLGNFRDSVDSMSRAVAYLTGPHKAFNVNYPLKRKPEHDLRRKENRSPLYRQRKIEIGSPPF
jgi:hypothetical protein